MQQISVPDFGLPGCPSTLSNRAHVVPVEPDALIPIRHVSCQSLPHKACARSSVGDHTGEELMRRVVTGRNRVSLIRDVRSASVRTSRGRRRTPPRPGWCPRAGPKRRPRRKPPPGGSARERSAKRSPLRSEAEVRGPCWGFFPLLLLLTSQEAGALASKSDDSGTAAGLPGALSQSQSCFILTCASWMFLPSLSLKESLYISVRWYRNNCTILLLIDSFFTDQIGKANRSWSPSCNYSSLSGFATLLHLLVMIQATGCQ